MWHYKVKITYRSLMAETNRGIACNVMHPLEYNSMSGLTYKRSSHERWEVLKSYSTYGNETPQADSNFLLQASEIWSNFQVATELSWFNCKSTETITNVKTHKNVQHVFKCKWMGQNTPNVSSCAINYCIDELSLLQAQHVEMLRSRNFPLSC